MLRKRFRPLDYDGEDNSKTDIQVVSDKDTESNNVLTSTPKDDHALTDSFADESEFNNISIEDTISYMEKDRRYNSFSYFLKSLDFEDEDCEPPTNKNLIKRERILDMDDDILESLSVQSIKECLSQNNKIIPIPSQNFEIVVLNHPSSVNLHGYLKVKVLCGIITICGYKLLPGRSITAFSFENVGLLQICTYDSDLCMSIKSMKKKLQKFKFDENVIENALHNCLPTTSIVIVEKQVYPPPLQFLQLYYPLALHKRSNKVPSLTNEVLCSNQKEINVIKMSLENQDILDSMSLEIIQAYEAGKDTRVMVYGGKHSGKSTFLRHIINMVLEKCKSVFYLDADPGQTEFTPPAVVSLTRIEEPIFGAPYTHQKSPLAMIFTGGISPEACPGIYINSVKKLFDSFHSKYPGAVLFVNTMGWTNGLGGVCNREILNFVQPTILAEFLPPDQSPVWKNEMLEKNVRYFQIHTIDSTKISLLLSRDLRHFSIVSYLGKGLKSFMKPTYLNSFRPYCVKWDDIAVYVMDRKLPPNRLIESIHGSFVALCKVNESCILEYEMKGLPKTLKKNPHNNCLGFGIVRSTDETNHLLYIVSPISLKLLRSVNAIIKGNVVVPEALFLQQPIVDVGLPFTDDCIEAPATSRQKINRGRQHKKSQH